MLGFTAAQEGAHLIEDAVANVLTRAKSKLDLLAAQPIDKLLNEAEVGGRVQPA